MTNHHTNPLVSVIIPVYNSEKYFEPCIKSVVEQTYRNLEIILVNDGCTDSTPDIINKYATIDSRIRVINKANQGTQFARRDGVSNATGLFVQNLDCDDILIQDSIERLVNKALQTEADIVAAPFYFCPEDAPAYPSQPLSFKETDGINYFKDVLMKRAYWATWTIFHKRQIYLDNHIEVVPEIMMTEDTILTPQLALNSKKVVSISEPTIRFTLRNTSLSNKKQISDARFEELNLYPKWIANYLETKNLTNTFEAEMACLKVRVIFEKFSKNRIDHSCDQMKFVLKTLKHHPEALTFLTKREQKIVRRFKMSSLFGLWTLHKYKRQGKL